MKCTGCGEGPATSASCNPSNQGTQGPREQPQHLPQGLGTEKRLLFWPSCCIISSCPGHVRDKMMYQRQ